MMFKLWATLKKDFRILTRDKVGLTLMFVMPIVLAVVITIIQNSTFQLVNSNKVPLLLSDRDNGPLSAELVATIRKIGIFNMKQVSAADSNQLIIDRMQAKDALVAIIIPEGYSGQTIEKTKGIAGRTLKEFGLETDSVHGASQNLQSVQLYFHPVLQESFRSSIRGALASALQIVESKQIVRNLYFSINEKEMPETVEDEFINNPPLITEISVARNGRRNVPNATQHNIPAWTIFAMFFVVISLGGSVVREKLNGSFIRLKTLPTSYLVALLSKQLTYLVVTLAQAFIIFSIGLWLFPHLGLPPLNLPSDLTGLFLVSLICGWCAVSYSICIGIFAETQEQANGFGAVSIVLLAAIGGLLVPAFAMPASFAGILKLSPLHWCLEAYYGLFLEGGTLKDIVMNIIPLLIMIVVIQFISLWVLKTKNLI
ncbi:MAG TPA: ABC transporter permease [Chitinophagaceae bacterium]|jgi:ABC-2 type transport system permease protein|nr:ABC transporter permease [Chitinophagaceae bacterium]